jgi:PHD/YefM family antitoxin component YafN of YafNO toxin-antitoxin module
LKRRICKEYLPNIFVPPQKYDMVNLLECGLTAKRRSAMQSAQTQFITSSNGRKKAVILPIREYQRLMEDLHDLTVVAERHDEYPVTLDEMKKRLTDHAPV